MHSPAVYVNMGVSTLKVKIKKRTVSYAYMYRLIGVFYHTMDTSQPWSRVCSAVLDILFHARREMSAKPVTRLPVSVTGL